MLLAQRLEQRDEPNDMVHHASGTHRRSLPACHVLEPIEGAYQRAMFIVALVNEFMRNIGNAPAEINQELYSAEARYCRALAYYTLMDLFGRPPFITEENYSLAPAQLATRADLFDWIESELLDIYETLPDTPEYGHAGKYAVDALLSRMYLNAEVYTGTERYTDCIARCNNILNSGRYSLADDYAEMFMADNTTNANANKEFIFPIQAAMAWACSSCLPEAVAKVPKAASAAVGQASAPRATWCVLSSSPAMTRAPGRRTTSWTSEASSTTTMVP